MGPGGARARRTAAVRRRTRSASWGSEGGQCQMSGACDDVRQGGGDQRREGGGAVGDPGGGERRAGGVGGSPGARLWTGGRVAHRVRVEAADQGGGSLR